MQPGQIYYIIYERTLIYSSRAQVTKDDQYMVSGTKEEKAGAVRAVGVVLIAIDPQGVEEARAGMPNAAYMALVVETFQALADPTRARILYALREHRLCVRDLAIIVGVSQSALSHQLALLRDRRLVKGEREGTTIYYALDDHHVGTLFREAEYHADHVLQGLPDHPQP